jgi:hypothetical protein
LAHRTIRCARTVQRPTLNSRVSQGATIIHRTVRCATGLSGAPAEQRLFSATVDCKSADQMNSARTVHTEVRVVARGTPDNERYMSGAAPDCPLPLEDKASNGQKLPNPNGWVTWLAHRTVRCVHQQQPSPTAMWWLRAINTPNHHHSKHPSFQHFIFNTRASAFTPRHNSKESKPLQVPNSLQTPSD